MTLRAISFTFAAIRFWWHEFSTAHPPSVWRDPQGRVCRLACGRCGIVFWRRPRHHNGVDYTPGSRSEWEGGA